MEQKVSADWLALAAEACADAGIRWRSIAPITAMDQQFEDSTHYRNNTVLNIDTQYVLKLFGPLQQRAYHVERAVLQTLVEHGKFPASRLVAAAETVLPFPYLFMTRVDGEAPDRYWTGYSVREKLALATELGVITRQLHQLPTNELAVVEAQRGGAAQEIALQQADRIREIEDAGRWTRGQRDQIIRFVTEEGHQFFDKPPVLTHADLSHAHIFVARQAGVPAVTGFVDWGGALVGPAEWDIAGHWFWTFSTDGPAMRRLLAAYYPDGKPERLARRCLATLFYTFSMHLLWPEFAERIPQTDDIVREMTELYFPPEIFGSPD